MSSNRELAAELRRDVVIASLSGTAVILSQDKAAAIAARLESAAEFRERVGRVLRDKLDECQRASDGIIGDNHDAECAPWAMETLLEVARELGLDLDNRKEPTNAAD